MEKNRVFLKKELPGRMYATICGMLIIVLTIAIVFFIASKGVATFTSNKYSVFDFLFSSSWSPENAAENGGPQLGTAIFLAGSILVSVFAC